MYDQRSKSPGVCRDCYAIADQDRFTEFAREYDRTQRCSEDTLRSGRELDPVTGKWIPLRRTNPLSPDQWRKILDNPDMSARAGAAMREELDKSILGHLQEQSQSLADKVDK